jgi:peptidoglycan/xylan/chitin deacetylase (PgdA/CDA1 family)
MTDTPTLEPWQWPEETWRPIVNKVRAGRSLTPASWPNGARAAVAISFDSDHEASALRNNERSPGKLSQGEYGARRAVPRILDLLARHEVPASFFVPAVVALLHPDQQRECAAAGHEIGIHGWIHERNSELERDDEGRLMLQALDTLEEITGRRPVGIRTPSWDFSPNTLSLIRELGLIYDSSLMADDDPYELLENGEPTGVVELPVEWIRDDFPYFNMDRASGLRPYTPPSGVFEVFQAEFDGTYEERGLFVLTMHPHVIGHRSRIRMLDRLIEYIRGHDDVWFATHEDIARYCLEQAAT